MTTAQERQTIQKQTIDIIEKAVGSDVQAGEYLWMMARMSRVVDDIYDQDQTVTREELLEVFEYLFIKMPTNEFFSRHYDVLQSQHISMWNAWMAANSAAQGDETDQIYSHVWRDTHHELIPIVALLTQGYDKMKELSSLIRTTFKKKLGE